MKGVLFSFIFLVGLYFAFGLFVGVVKAGCDPGWYCAGTTVIDIQAGCNGPFGAPPGYCTQKWQTNFTVSCDANCSWSWTFGEDCCNLDCSTYQCPTHNTNCCVKELCPAAGTCTTNCGANAGVPDGSCGTTACACIECGPYISAWSAWSTSCGNGTRTRTCTENCGTNDCNAFFDSKVGCDVAANCSYVGNTQTETRCNECVTCAAPLCGQATNCSGACSNSDIGNCSAPYCGQLDPCGYVCSSADNGAPSTPTCSNLGNVSGSPQTINWTSGGALADKWYYSLNGGVATLAPTPPTPRVSASVAVACGTNTWQAMAQNTTCGTDDSLWSSSCSLCSQCTPSAPTCTSIAPSTDSTPTINWTSGGASADTWFYRIDGGAAVADSDLTASPAVTCGSHTWQALARDNTCGNADSSWTASACSLCYQCPADTPINLSPANGTQVYVNQPTVLDWGDVASWGAGCPNSNKYEVCLSSDTSSCDLGYISPASTPPTSQYTWTPTTVDPTAYWAVIANNGYGAFSPWSVTKNVCVEGFDNGASFSYVSNWGAWSGCGVSHTRSTTRTCTETCGVDDCNAFMSNPANCPAGSTCIYNAVTKTQTRTEDCTATITGTLFDASDLSYCPGDIGTDGAYASLRYGNEPFGLTGPWPIISAPVSTDANGNYSESVYVPGVYNYDYSELISSGRAAAVKLQCQSSVATIITQAEVVTKDTGFWRVYGGWWQVAGGSVYAKSGIKSSVPASVIPTSDQKLILADTNGRSGVLNYGVPWAGTELGTNPEAKVSTPLWRIESLYDGLRYDYNFYNTRMDVFTSTAWGGDFGSYDDGGVGYQIFKSGNDVTLNASTLTTEKIILLVDGDVTVSGDLIVPNGAFLGVIASGNITFGSAVTEAQGWFVAENINIPCKDTVVPLGTCDKDDVQFAGEGSFAGWTGVDLSRDMYTGNNSAPSEKFAYRSDMMLNVPAPMKVYTKKFAPFIP